MNPSDFKIVAVIPVHNRRTTTLQCLKSLSRCLGSGIDLSVIVVDDGSTDGTSGAISQHFPYVETIKGDGSLFFTAGMNLGIKRALQYEPDFILTINDDSVFSEDFLVNLVKTASGYHRAIVGALLLLWDQPHRVFQVAPRWETLSGGFRHFRQQTIWTVPAKEWEVELIVGNCVLFPAAAFKECGLMNEKLLPQYGDAEFTPRLKRAGWKLLIEPRARVFCQPNEPPRRLSEMGIRGAFHALFISEFGPHSIKRRFFATVLGAPNRVQGLAAFFIFYLRWILRINLEGPYGSKKKEPDIRCLSDSHL